MSRTLCALVLFSAALSAQAPCSNLAVAGTLTPGDTITVSVSMTTPEAATFLVVGDAGTTSISLGFAGTLDLGIAMPFFPIPLGLSDLNGDASASFAIPAEVPASALPASLSFQAVSLDFGFGMGGPPSLGFCTSNVVTL